LALGSAGAACDRGLDPIEPPGSPNVHVVWHYPANEAIDVATRTSIRVQFDRFLAPDSAVRQALCLTPQTVGAEVEPGCIGGLLPQYDPVDRVAVWLLPGYLAPDTRYNVRVIAPKNNVDPNGIRAFDGAPLDGALTFAFRTAAGAHAQPADPRRDISLCTPSAALDCPRADGACGIPIPDSGAQAAPAGLLSSCAGASANCHAQGAPGGPGPRGSGLSLSLDGIRRIVESSQIATETATEPDPAAAHRSPAGFFGWNMPYVDRNRPASSYLVYKLVLADPSNCVGDADVQADPIVCAKPGMPPATDAGAPSAIDPWIADAEWRPPAPGERARLRLRIKGLGMPPGTRVSHRWAQTVSAWIAAGAKVDGCP
jgi:hypothetical protein